MGTATVTAVADAPTISREKAAPALPDRIRQPLAPIARLLSVDVIDVGTNVREDLGDLTELAASIAARGILEPITVTANGSARYLVKTGHRRLAAAKLAGVEMVPAIVASDQDTADRSIDQLIENIQRDDLNGLDLARALRDTLAARKGLTQAALATELGKSAPWVANLLALLKAPAAVQERVAAGSITAAHARAIAGLPAGEQERLAKSAETNGTSAHALERDAQWYRERQGDLGKRAKASATAGKAAVEALRKANTSTDVGVYVSKPWDLDSDVVNQAVEAAGWKVTNQWGSKPGPHCDCRTVHVAIQSGDGTTIERICTAEAHQQAEREERDREWREKSERESAEAKTFRAAITQALTDHPIDKTIARLLARAADGYNGHSWSEYSKMGDTELRDALAAFVTRPGGGGKPVPHDKVLEALGIQAPRPDPAPKVKAPRPRPQASLDEAVAGTVTPDEQAAIVAGDDLFLFDGTPKTGFQTRVKHPGAEVSFSLPDGTRPTFHTDAFATLQANLRAISNGLEALRAVDRYGITTGGEQYAGFAQLAAGDDPADRGARLVEEAGGLTKALMKYHPDHGGSETDIIAVQAYRKRAGF